MWELATCSQMRPNVELPQLVTLIAQNKIVPPSKHADVPPEIDAVVMRALATDPMERYAHASEMATALSAALAPASHETVGAWVRDIARVALTEREERFRAIESAPLPEETKAKSSRWRWALAVVPVAIGAIVLVRFLPTRAHEVVPLAAPAASSVVEAPLASSSAPVALASTAPTATTTAARPIPTKLRPRGAPKIDCRVPYVVDSTGVRVPKPECMNSL
jgi:serine/threonine-protein kinase